jgi:hypothetical protein
LIFQGVETGIHTFCAFLLASRGAWSLGIFVVSHWTELVLYWKNEQMRRESISNPRGKSIDHDMLSPPKDEEELVQLNVALQKEIVRFTASGIRQALRGVEITRPALERSSSSLKGAFSIFVSNLALYVFSLLSLLTTVTSKPKCLDLQIPSW